MAKIALSVTADYCPSWGAWEFIREVVQNAADAHDDGCKMTVKHSGDTLTISNANVVMDTRILLLGGTMGKSPTARGMFKEGLKIGILAAVRNGLNVAIYNGAEVWRPAIEMSEQFAGQRVLVIHTHKLRIPREDFTVEIEGINKEVWTALEKRFLFLKVPPSHETIPVEGGTILLNDAYKGSIFCRGIYVCTIPDMVCGYDIPTLQLDRDRKVVDSWNLKRQLSDLWNTAIATSPERHSDRVYQMVKSGSDEVAHLRYYATKEMATALRAELEKEYGEGVLPVSNMKEAQEVEELGLKPVVVDSAFKELLERDGQTTATRKEAQRKGIKRRFASGELSLDERSALITVVGRVVDLAHVVIVEFNDTALLGQFNPESQQLQFTRGALALQPRGLLRMAVTQEALRTGVDAETIYLGLLYPLVEEVRSDEPPQQEVQSLQ